MPGQPTWVALKVPKWTLPLIAALAAMGPGQRRLVAELMTTPDPGDPLVAEVMQLVETAGGLDYARRRAVELAQRDEAELEILAPSAPGAALRDSHASA